MGLITMSERDVQRIEVLSKVIDGRATLVSAARVLALSERQVRRLLERIRTNGAASIRHKAIGRPSNNRISSGMRDYALALIRERYADFGPTLAAEKLAELDGLTVSRETLRQWMTEAGIWLSRKQRRTFHQPRLRRMPAEKAAAPPEFAHRDHQPVGGSLVSRTDCRTPAVGGAKSCSRLQRDNLSLHLQQGGLWAQPGICPAVRGSATPRHRKTSVGLTVSARMLKLRMTALGGAKRSRARSPAGGICHSAGRYPPSS
jgi:hypothetical protein